MRRWCHLDFHPRLQLNSNATPILINFLDEFLIVGSLFGQTADISLRGPVASFYSLPGGYYSSINPVRSFDRAGKWRCASMATKYLRTSWGYYKQGCTGKVYYTTPSVARDRAYHLQQRRANAQVYKCNHCRGYHITSTRLRMCMSCPAKPFPHGTHLYRVRRMWKSWSAYCVFCAVRLDGYIILQQRHLKLLRVSNPDNEFKRAFIRRLVERRGATIALTEEQYRLVEHLLRFCGAIDQQVV